MNDDLVAFDDGPVATGGDTGASTANDETMRTESASVVALSENFNKQPWVLEEVRDSLRKAVTTLSDRSLKLASKWAAEQLMGLPPVPHKPAAKKKNNTPSTQDVPPPFQASAGSFDHDDMDDHERKDDDKDPAKNDDYAAVLYARTLLDLGEYERAAYVLSTKLSTATNEDNHNGNDNEDGGEQKERVDTNNYSSQSFFANSSSLIGPPLPYLSSEGVYVRAYALFLAGQRRKEERTQELRDPLERCNVTNPYLLQLQDELGRDYNYQCNEEPYKRRKLDAFGLYVYAVVLKERQAKQPQSRSDFPNINTNNNRNGDRTPQYQQKHHYIQPSAQNVFVESLLLYPHNWSAWLDLAELCFDNYTVIQEVETLLSPLKNHWMYHFFLVYVFNEKQEQDQALLLIDQLMNGTYVVSTPPAINTPTLSANTAVPTSVSATTTTEGTKQLDDDEDIHDPNADPNESKININIRQGLFGKCNYLIAMTAVVLYGLSDYDSAQRHFVRLFAMDPYRLEHMDLYSNILYVQERRSELSQLAHTAVRNDKYRPETCCIVGNYYSLKGQHLKAVHYFQRALRLDRTCLSAWTLMGHEFVEMKNTAAAIEAYRRAVDINPRDYRAWYGLGQTYEILNMLLYAQFYYRRATVLRPYDARMWCAMGGCYEGLERYADAMRSYERAISNHDKEGVATRKLATLYRNAGQDEKAANCYMAHLELKMQQQLNLSSSSTTASPTPPTQSSTYPSSPPTSSSPQHPHPPSSSPDYETVINLVQVDAHEAEALLYLAHYYKDNGNFDASSKCCSRLLEYPGPEKEEAKALLREIKSRIRFHQDIDLVVGQPRQHGESSTINTSAFTTNAVAMHASPLDTSVFTSHSYSHDNDDEEEKNSSSSRLQFPRFRSRQGQGIEGLRSSFDFT